ncbi:MAG: glutathione S-transferase family protein [Pseudomonadota bacterium]
MAVTLYGYEHSVYAWIARFALTAKGVPHEWEEVDPFAEVIPADYLARQPFGRVPTLVHGGFTLYETGAITRYIDAAFHGPDLRPSAPKARARVDQAMSIVDAYVYQPLVRQVFANGPMATHLDREGDEDAFKLGLAAAPRVLDALEALAGDGSYLVGGDLSLADIQLAPMIAYFTAAEEGAALIAKRERLDRWWRRASGERALAATAPPAWKPPG